MGPTDDLPGDDNRTMSLDEAGPRAEQWVGGRYALETLIGRGGGGAVWRARDRVNGEHVAVKILTPETANQLVRAGREVTALRLLSLPGVVRLRDSGDDWVSAATGPRWHSACGRWWRSCASCTARGSCTAI
jgi:hypothetical protein